MADTQIADQQAAESQTTEIAVEDFTAAQRTRWLEGKPPIKAAPAPAAEPKPSDAKPKGEAEPAPASEPGSEAQDHPKTVARKAALETEIQDLLKKRAELRREVSPGSENGVKAADPPPAKPAEKLEAPKRPKASDFNGDKAWEEYEDAQAKYLEDLATFKAKQIFAEHERERAKADEQRTVAETNRVIEDSWKKRVGEAVKKHPDFLEMANDKVPVNAAGDGFILDSPVGAEILYHLATNLEDAARIKALGPFATVRELIALEAKLSGTAVPAAEPEKPVPAEPAKPQPQTKAPRPPTELKGGNAEPADEVVAAVAAGDFASYLKLMNSRETKR